MAAVSETSKDPATVGNQVRHVTVTVPLDPTASGAAAAFTVTSMAYAKSSSDGA